MPSSNTPTSFKRNTRSNSQNEVTLDNIKILLENLKKEIITFVKDELNWMKESITVLSSRVDVLEKENEVLREKVQSLQLTASEDHHNSCPIDQDDQFERILFEIEQKHLKRKNLIIRGLPEQNSGSVVERNEADLDRVQDILQAIGVDKKSVTDAYRLGRIIPNRPRPLKIKCKKEDTKREILIRAKTLKNSQDFKKVYIDRDMTVEEQRKQKILRAELMKRRIGGENVVIRRGRVVHFDSCDGIECYK